MPSTALLDEGDVVDGHYEIRALIGSGGMAEVYLAFDRWLERHVALKATRPELEPHLEREARVLGSIRHPGVVTVFAYGRHRGLPYLVLEYLGGRSLTNRIVELSDRPFPVDDALNLAVGLCDATGALHDKGIAHCDLKPGNVMCFDGRVVLIDFGLVWRFRVEQSRTSFSGSPPFMPPEVIRGDVHADQAPLIDLYAIGMLLYGMLAGVTPFEGDDAQTVMERQLVEDAAPLCEMREDLPPRLSLLVAALIHRDPALRIGSAAKLKEALLGIPRRRADRR